MKSIIKKYFVTFLYYLFRIFPINNKKIYVSNYYGKGYGDIPKYIVDYILKNTDDYKIIWVVKDNNIKLPNEIKTVKINSIKRIYEQVTSKYWIDNCRKQSYERKRKKQFYIQTWHGGIPLKKIEGSVEQSLEKDYIEWAKNDSKMANIFVSDNKFLSSLYKTVFWYDKDILECRSPKNDIIYENNIDIIKKVKKFYNLKSKDFICLYAPTFRKDKSLDAYNIEFENLRKSLINKFGGNWVILIRLHPNISELSNDFIKYDNKNIINASNYSDMQELLVSTDFLISDYSSCMFDYGMSMKKGCMYASDIESYTADRGFYFEFKELPYELATNNDELSKLIENYDEEKTEKRLKEFFEKIGLIEDIPGSKTVADLIINDKTTSNKENKTLLFNTIMLYIMMISTFLFPLLMFPYLTRILGKENYGIVVLANAVMQYFQLLIDFGFILSGTAICSKERNNKERLQQIVSSIIYGKLILSLLGLIIVCVLTFTLPLFNGKELFIICSYIPLVLTSFVPDYLFRGIEKMGVITYRTIIAKLVYTVLIFVLVKNANSYFYIPFSLFVSNLIIVIWSWSYIIKSLKIKLILVKFKEVMYQLKESSTFFASRIATTVYSASNVFVLGLYGYSDAALGIYGASNTLINYGKSMFSPISDALYPYMVKNKNHKLVKKIICVLVPIIVAGCVLLYFLSDLFITIMCGKDYLETVPYFRRMIPMLIITLPSYLYGFPMLGSINRNDKANLSVLLGAAFHFIGLVILYVFKLMTFYNIIYLTTATESLILIIRVYYFNKYKKQEKRMGD